MVNNINYKSSKKIVRIISCLFVIIVSGDTLLWAQNFQIKEEKPASTSVEKLSQPVCKVQSFYRYGKDKKPVREIMLYLNDPKIFGKGTLEITCLGKKEVTTVFVKEGTDSLAALL